MLYVYQNFSFMFLFKIYKEKYFLFLYLFAQYTFPILIYIMIHVFQNYILNTQHSRKWYTICLYVDSGPRV